MPIFWRLLIINACWILLGFFCIHWDYHMVLIFQFVSMAYPIYWFVYIEESLHPWNKPNLIFSMCCWIMFAKILLRTFASIFISDICQEFSFFMLSLPGFGIRMMVASLNVFGCVHSSAIFWKNFRRIGISSSLNVWWNSPVKPSGPGLLFVGSFFWKALFFAARFSLVVESGGYSSLQCASFSLQWLLLLLSTGSRHVGFSSCGAWV